MQYGSMRILRGLSMTSSSSWFFCCL